VTFQHATVVLAFLTLGAPAAQEPPPPAQQVTPPPAPPSPPPVATASLRFQARTMEGVLVQAVTSGVQRYADQILAVIPNLPLFSGNPHAHGYQVEPHGWVFDVEVPDFRSGTVDLAIEIFGRTQGNKPAPNPNAQRPVANGQTQTVIPEPDPFDAPVFKDPQGEYRSSVREALLDAMLEYGGSLPLKEGEWLTVCARRPDPPFPTFAMQNDPNAVVMQIRGEDLALFRQKKITKEEAKAKIVIKDQR
jgi:hypothetical protein